MALMLGSEMLIPSYIQQSTILLKYGTEVDGVSCANNWNTIIMGLRSSLFRDGLGLEANSSPGTSEGKAA